MRTITATAQSVRIAVGNNAAVMKRKKNGTE